MQAFFATRADLGVIDLQLCLLYLQFVRDHSQGNYYDDIVILLGTGLRVSELYGLTKADIDFAHRCIHITHQLCRTAEKPYFIAPPKTKSGVRTIPMTDGVYMALRRVLRDRIAPEQEPVVDDYSGFLFLDKAGKPRSPCTCKITCEFCKGSSLPFTVKMFSPV